MKIDLGCGDYCRGDVGITLYNKSLDDSGSSRIDSELLKYGFYRQLVAEIRVKDITKATESEIKGNDILMSHILEHLERPFEMLRKLKKFGASTVTIVVPNAQKNEADWLDRSHIFSFTQPSLESLMWRFSDNVMVKPIVDGYDLIGHMELKA